MTWLTLLKIWETCPNCIKKQLVQLLLVLINLKMPKKLNYSKKCLMTRKTARMSNLWNLRDRSRTKLRNRNKSNKTLINSKSLTPNSSSPGTSFKMILSLLLFLQSWKHSVCTLILSLRGWRLPVTEKLMKMSKKWWAMHFQLLKNIWWSMRNTIRPTGRGLEMIKTSFKEC